ncbi:hypothetical protein HTZ84_22060, partial [Haloterrigena sp. SYSU A558-1]|nr:hypothetical protein [Haloterrigena gelatinilytica]
MPTDDTQTDEKQLETDEPTMTRREAMAAGTALTPLFLGFDSDNGLGYFDTHWVANSGQKLAKDPPLLDFASGIVAKETDNGVEISAPGGGSITKLDDLQNVDVTGWLEGTFADRPASDDVPVGTRYWATDRNTAYRNTSNGWDVNGGMGTSSNPLPEGYYGSLSAGETHVTDTGTDPGTAGELRRNGTDVKVYSGGATRNLSDIGSGAYRNASDYSGADGGEQIQAAINDLPARGGVVFIPTEGPDSTTNAEGATEDNVWEVNTPIDTGDKNAVRIIGEMSGWDSSPGPYTAQTGTTVIAGSTLSSPMIQLRNGWLDRIEALRIDGAERADIGLKLGRDDAQRFDFQVKHCLLHNCNIDQIQTGTVAQNIWIQDSWIESTVSGSNAEINIRTDKQSVWIQDNIIGESADAAIRIGTNGPSKIWI